MKHTWQKRCCGSFGSACFHPCEFDVSKIWRFPIFLCFVPLRACGLAQTRQGTDTKRWGVDLRDARAPSWKNAFEEFWLVTQQQKYHHIWACSRLGPVQGVEVLSKNSFNFKLFYTILLTHVDLLIRFDIFSNLHNMCFLANVSLSEAWGAQSHSRPAQANPGAQQCKLT